MTRRSGYFLLCLPVLFLAAPARADCVDFQRDHCAGLYNKRGRDAFRVDGRIDRPPAITVSEKGAGASAEVVGDPRGANTVNVLWAVGRYACIKYRIRVCFRR